MKNKIPKLIQNLMVIMAILIVTFLVVSRFSPKLGYRLFLIQSDSMEPTIKIGSIVLSHQKDNYKLGDIISFRNGPQSIVTHRVADVIVNDQGTFLKTKGDANFALDTNMVDQKYIYGKSVLVVPYLGYILLFSKTKTGLILLITIPALWFIIDESFRLNQMLKQKKLEQSNGDA